MERLTRSKRLVTTIYAMIIVIVTTTVAIGVYDYSIKEGTITVDGNKKEITTKKSTVEELLQEQAIKLENTDYINMGPDEKIKSGFDIKIKKAVSVSVIFKDNVVNVKTTEDTVKGVLNSLAITHRDSDKITPSLDTKIKEGLQISVTEVNEKIQTYSEEIDYKEIVKDNGNLEKGKTLTVQPGIKGIKQNKVKEVYENGSLISREVIESKVVREPVDQIVQKGTKEIVQVASRGETSVAANTTRTIKPVSLNSSVSASLAGKRSIVMNASAYDLSFASTGKNPGDRGYGITASGTMARPGVVAVDPRVIPLGTKLYIESLDGTKSYGYASAEDKGGAIKGNRIDLFFSNRSDALNFGRRNVKVYILD